MVLEIGHTSKSLLGGLSPITNRRYSWVMSGRFSKTQMIALTLYEPARCGRQHLITLLWINMPKLFKKFTGAYKIAEIQFFRFIRIKYIKYKYLIHSIVILFKKTCMNMNRSYWWQRIASCDTSCTMQRNPKNDQNAAWVSEMNERRQWMKLSFINFNVKMTPSKLLTSVLYNHLSFKSPSIKISKYVW